MSKGYGAPFEIVEIKEPQFPAEKFNILDYRTTDLEPRKDKKLIQRTIDACAAAGGGIVLVPEGQWLTGPIHLRSNVHLKFLKGAEVHFSDQFSDYLPVVFTRWEGLECYNYSPLIYARDCENIAITGEGILYGNGQAWWHWKQLQQAAADELCYAESNNIPVDIRVFGTEQAALRPQFVQPINCKNVLIEGITLIDGPQWTLHPVYCENLIIRKVKVNTNGPNTDGLNPDSCKNVLVEDSHFKTGDDCVAINSGMNEDGWRVNKPCENVVVRNCIMEGGHGGVVIGSAMSGGVRNIYIHDCKISGNHWGIRLKSMRGRGGYVEKVWFENIEINNVGREAIHINMYYPYSTVVPRSEAPPRFDQIYIKNVTGAGAAVGIEIRGLPEQPLQEITLDNINLKADQSLVCVDVEKLSLNQVRIEAKNHDSAVIENVKQLTLKQVSLG